MKIVLLNEYSYLCVFIKVDGGGGMIVSDGGRWCWDWISDDLGVDEEFIFFLYIFVLYMSLKVWVRLVDFVILDYW